MVKEMLTVFLKDLRILNPFEDMDETGSILIEQGKITAMGPDIRAPAGIKTLDMKGKWAAPGLWDIHVHFREPGEEYKETVATGLKSAVAGGFTHVCTMPNTKPPNDSTSVTRFIQDRAAECGLGRVFPVAAITKGQKGEELTEFGDLLDAGAVAFSDDGVPVKNSMVMRLALEYSRSFDALVISHSEDLELAKNGVMNEGRMSTLLGLTGIPNAAEDIQVYRDIRLAELTSARLHIAHVSTREAVEVIRRAKERGVNVTCETAPHYFSLTEEAVDGYNTLCKMNPPLRTEEDRLAIIEGLKDGAIDCIATDHAPHSVLEKECEFEKAANGVIGLETALPLGLALVDEGHLSPLGLVHLLTRGPREVLGMDGPGMAVGERADLVIIDPERPWEITPRTLHSRSHNSPFLGKTLKGRAIFTVYEGRVVFDLDGLLDEAQDPHS